MNFYCFCSYLLIIHFMQFCALLFQCACIHILLLLQLLINRSFYVVFCVVISMCLYTYVYIVCGAHLCLAFIKLLAVSYDAQQVCNIVCNKYVTLTNLMQQIIQTVAHTPHTPTYTPMHTYLRMYTHTYVDIYIHVCIYKGRNTEASACTPTAYC